MERPYNGFKYIFKKYLLKEKARISDRDAVNPYKMGFSVESASTTSDHD